MPPRLSIALDDLEARLAPDRAEARDPAALRRRLLSQENRDYELWTIVVSTSVFSVVSVAALILPTVVWGLDVVELRGRYLPQLVLGLAVLVTLLNAYVVVQRRKLRKVHHALVEQLARAEEAVGKSLTDPLTGVLNRLYLDELLPREARRTDRSGAEFALAMIDVDDFSSINNRLGHLEGDRCLQQVAQILESVFRESDTVMRYGGDEFVVFMPNTTEQLARFPLERLAAETAAWNESSAADYRLSLSCGVAAYDGSLPIEEVLDLADRRMYNVKHGDRSSAEGTA